MAQRSPPWTERKLGLRDRVASRISIIAVPALNWIDVRFYLARGSADIVFKWNTCLLAKTPKRAWRWFMQNHPEVKAARGFLLVQTSPESSHVQWSIRLPHAACQNLQSTTKTNSFFKYAGRNLCSISRHFTLNYIMIEFHTQHFFIIDTWTYLLLITHMMHSTFHTTHGTKEHTDTKVLPAEGLKLLMMQKRNAWSLKEPKQVKLNGSQT